MDNIDLAILAALERDGRLSFSELADRVGLSKTPCWSRVQALEKSGAICGYHAEIDPEALSLGISAYVQIMIDSGKREEFESAVLAQPSIIECSTAAGDADYMLHVVCKDVLELDDLLRYGISTMPGVQRSVTIICLRKIKNRSPITDSARMRLRKPG